MSDQQPVIVPPGTTEPIYGAKGASGPPRRPWVTLSTEEKQKMLRYYSNLNMWFMNLHGLNHVSDDELQKVYKHEPALDDITDETKREIIIELYRISLWINTKET